MKIAHRLLLLVVLTLLMTQVLLYSLIQHREIQSHSHAQFEHVATIEQQLELIRNQLWQVYQTEDTMLDDAMGPLLIELEQLIEKGSGDSIEQTMLLNNMKRIVSDISRLVTFTDQQMGTSTIASTEQQAMLMARFSTAFRTMTETIFQYQRSVIASTTDIQQTNFYIVGAAMLVFTLILVGLTSRTYSQFSQNLAVLNRGISELAKGDMKSKIYLPTYDELAKLANEFNRMKACLDETTILKDELSSEVSKQTQQLEQQQEKLRYLADHDDLTGLFSRSAFNNLLEVCLLRCQRNKQKAGLLFIDLDKFKPINDTYGHTVGDIALVEISDRMKELLRKSDVIARFGGDEFVILVEAIKHQEELMSLAQKLQDCLNLPLYHQGHTLELGISVGISVYPHDGVTAQELILNADDAMYKAKKAGGQTCFFASAIS